MESIKITDSIKEQVEIGRQIFYSHPEEYTERRMTYMKKHLNEYMFGKSKEDKEAAFFRSIYDYWVYGNDIEEEFIFSFPNKVHEEKSKYITVRNKFLYLDYLNNHEDEKIFGDKFLTYCKFKDEYKRQVILISNEEDYDLFCRFVDRNPVFFVKPHSLAMGIGIYKESINKWNNKRELFEYLLHQEDYSSKISWALGNKIVLEEVVQQCEEMKVLNPTTVNIIRLTTVLVDGETKFVSACLRIGRYGKDAVSDADGEIYCGVDLETGVVDTDGLTVSGEIFEEHPDNKIRFRGYQIPRWNEMLEFGVVISKRVPTVRYVGWDLALTDNGWVIIEGNEHGDFLSQIVYKKPCREEFEELIGYKPEKFFWWG